MTAIQRNHRQRSNIAWLLWVLPVAWLAADMSPAICWAQQATEEQQEEDDQTAEQEEGDAEDDDASADDDQADDEQAADSADDEDASADQDPDAEADEDDSADTDGQTEIDSQPAESDEESAEIPIPPSEADASRDDADSADTPEEQAQDDQEAEASAEADKPPKPAKKLTAKQRLDARRKRMTDIAKRNQAKRRQQQRARGRATKPVPNASRRNRLSTKTGVAQTPDRAGSDQADGDDGNRARSPKPRRTPANPRARKTLDRRRATKQTPPATQGRASHGKTGAKRTPNQANDQTDPANLGEPPPVVEVDTEPIKFDIPPEERTYQFSFEKVDYKQLLDAFSRMSGLAIVGDPPPGKVTFKTTEVMDFKTALSRLKLLLFKHRDNYWLVHNDDVLEVTRITEMIRDVLEPEDIYPNVAAYRAANRDKTDLVMLIYSPDKGSVQDLAEIRDFLPDYVRSATLEDPEKNAMYIFALVRDIDKFLDLVALFDQAGADPRIIKKIPVVEVTPSEAIQALGELMDLAAAPTPRRTSSKRSASPAGPTREIKLFPDNAQRVIIVRALPSDIAEIERLLPFIDVELGDEFAPVIISLTYITAGEIMPQLTPLLAARPAETQARPNPRAKRTPPRRTPRGRTAAAAPAQSGDVTVVPEPRTNTLIVVGSEKGVARVRQIVAILDVPGKGRAPQFVKLEHVAANETATWIQQMIGQIHPGGDASRPFSATPDARDNTIILVGNPIDVEQAVKLIAQKDRKGAKPDLHKHRLTHALPSEVAAMLTRLDAQASGAPPPPVRRTSKRKGRKVSRPTPRRGTQASGKFIGNDDLRMIYVICTDDEWESDYLPQIVAFDEDASPIRLEKHRIELTQADPTDVINTLIQVLGAGGATLPVMTAVKDAILVVDATPNQLERIEALVPELDIDPGLERKIFPIAHADPNDVRDVVLAMISANSPRPAPRRAAPPKRGRRKGKTPPRRITPAQPTDDIRMVPVGKSLMVSAPADKMPEIQDLIAQVDVPADDERDIRVYPFADSIDVQDLADTLGKLYGGKSVRPGRKGARPTPVGSTGVIFVAQPRAGKLLVSAPVDDFSKIEEKIQLLATESQDIEIVYEFIPTLEGTADTVVSLIEPILRAKISNLRTIGVLPQPTPGKAQQGQNLLTIQADPQGDRIIISAPRVVVAEARALVQQIDRPTDDSQRVFRTVLLEKTNPQDMARTIQSMITGQKARPVPAAAQRKKGRAPARGRVAAIRGDDLDVVVTPAPGGSALVLAGAVRDVETVEGWIKTMDRDAVGTGKIVKLYDLQGADVEQVADMLMAVVDTAATSARRPAGKAPKSDSGGGFFDMFDSEVKRKGKDLYISGDTFAGTLLVAATPAKMREVDDIVGQFLPDETGVTRIPGPTEALPYMTYELACTDAYDAAYALSGILDVLWPYENKPQVESVPFMDNLIVIKGDPEHFGKVEDLIKEHVDKCGDGKAVTRSYLTAAGTGMTAKDGALMLKAQLEAMGYEVDVLSLEPEDPTELEEVKISPCHLPPVAFASIRSALMAVDMQDPAKSTPSQEAPSQENQAQDSAEQVLRRFADAQQAAENEPAKEKPPAEPEKPKLRIVFANNTGQIVLEGASVAVSEAERLVESIKKELEDVTAPPEIRIFRLAHISVTKAADILEEMFNDRRRARQLQQIAAQQRRAQQQQAQRQRQQQQQAAKGEKKGQRQPAQAQPPQPAANLAAQMPEWNVTVYPNPRDRTLIIKAATEAFPRIINLLKKIDKDPKAPLDYKIFTLKNLIASDVEEQLKAMLGLDRSRSRARRPGGGRGTARPGAQPGQDNLLQMEMPGGAGAIAAEEITLSSNPGTNSILVMAPKEAMELVERFITDMEELNTPQFVTQTYEMKHADVTDVVTQVEKFFKATKARPAAKGGGQGFDPLAVNAPMFLADARTNTLIVRALEIDLPKIEPLISQLDVPYEQGAVREYALTHVGADQMAATLQKIYATKKNTAKGGKSVNIVADADANMIFVAAPPAIQKDIADRIASADRIAAGRMAPKVLTVNVGKPSSIAAKISEALGAGRKGKAHLSIIGDDSSKRLIVTAPDEIIPQIRSLLTLLDQPPSGLDLRIYPLQHAQAQAVLTSMNEMVLKLKGQVAGKGIDLDVFSATADERSNSLVVMGGPTTFLLVEKVLKELDVEGQAYEQRSYRTFALQNTDATEMQQILTEYMRLPGKSAGGKRGAAGRLRGDVRLSAMGATNSLVVSGEAAAIDHLAELIATLDVEVADSSAAPKIIQLTYAHASEVEPALTKLFAQQKRGKGSSAMPPPVIVADDGSNTLLVKASAVDYSQIKNLVDQMDSEEAAVGTGMKILTLKPGVSAVEMANNVDELLDQQAQYLPKPKGGQRPQRVLVRADTRSNSLILSGPQSKFDEVETLVRDLEKLGPAGGRISMVVPINNRNPQEIKDLIDQLVEESKNRTGGGKRSRRPASRSRRRR